MKQLLLFSDNSNLNADIDRVASTSKGHDYTVSNLESDITSSDSELGISLRSKENVYKKQSSQSIKDHAEDENTEGNYMESEDVNEDNRCINEEIENEKERNETSREVVMRDVSDSKSSNDNSEETKDNENDETWDEVEKLRQWAIQSHIEHCHLDSLLRILRKRLIPDLPATAKTFLKTVSVNYQIKEFRSNENIVIGEFVYFGIASGLRRCVNKKVHLRDVLHLQINCDGLPLYKSSAKQFWPILCKVHNNPDIYKPFLVAVFFGDGKPYNLNNYLSDFIEEMNKLTQEGLIIEERTFKIRIMCFICDIPARSFLKCIKGHGGYNACERCFVPGQRCQNRTVYVSTRCAKRTDKSFRQQEDSEHHVGISPLLRLEPPIDMIKQFVLDFMHQGYLGVMKKMLVDFWLEGNLATKLSQSKKRQLSQRLVQLQSQIPVSDFQRTTRSVADISKWKTTEYRLFLLYVGPIILQQILEKRYYNHFLLLHAACRILNSENLCLKYNSQAKVYLNNFVMLTKQYYNTQSLVLNIHSLTHLADDVEDMKCSLSNYTAFPFENLLGKIKKMLRSGNRPLAQLCRRLHESLYTEPKKVMLPHIVTILKKDLPKPCGQTPVKKIKYKEIILTCKEPNNTVSLINKKIMNIKEMYIPQNGEEEDITLIGNKLKIMKPMFTYPCNSGKLDMWQVIKTEKKITCSLQSVACKMVSLQTTTYENIDDEDSDDEEKTQIFVMPLLHM